MFRSILSALALLQLAFFAPEVVAAAPQGLDCSNPQAISDLGIFPYDNTTGGQSSFGMGTACVASNTSSATERYFLWTALQAGDYEIRLDVQTTDRALGVFFGSDCNAACTGGSSVQGSLGSLQRVRKVLGVSAGDTYLIRIANSNQPGGSGDLEVAWDPCYLPQVIDDALEDNDTCATAYALLPGLYPQLFVNSTDWDFYKITIPPLHNATLETPQSTKLILLQEHGAGCIPIGNTNFTWSQDNLGFTSKEYVIRARTLSGLPCSVYDLLYTSNPVDCFSSTGADDGFEDNDSCATPAAIAPGLYQALWTTSDDRDYFFIDVPAGDRLTLQAVSAQGELGFDLLDSGCQTLATSNLELQHTNFTAQTQTYIFSPTNGDVWCAEYDLSVSSSPDPCIDLGPDVLHEHEDFQYISNGTYPAVFVDPFTSRTLCVPAGSTMVLDVNLRRPDGIVDATILCLLPVSDCFFFPTYATGSGQTFSVQWTNNTGSERILLAFFQYSGGIAGCNHMDLTVSGAGAGTGFLSTDSFCQPAQSNSTGQATTLFPTQTFEIPGFVQMECVQGPPGEFGFLLAGTGTQIPGTTISQGRLCLDLGGGNQLGRYNIVGTSRNSLGQFDSFGRMVNLVGTSDSDFGYLLPGQTPWAAVFQTGQTFHFQVWHRESAGQSNFSNGVSVVF